MNNWEVALYALQAPGTKICSDSHIHEENRYMSFIRGRWVAENLVECNPDFSEGLWSLYKEPVEMIEMHAPLIVWHRDWLTPRLASEERFSKFKIEESEIDGVKVLEWKTIKIPSTWGQCE